MPTVTTHYVVPRATQNTNLGNTTKVAAATANACQTNGSQQASTMTFRNDKFFSGFFGSSKASLPMSSGSSSSTSSSQPNSILGGHFSSLTNQVLSSIRQHQQGGQSGQSGQSAQSPASSVACPPVPCPTPAANSGVTNSGATTTSGASGTASSDLSTTVSLALLDQNKAKWDQAAGSGNYSFSLLQRDAHANAGTGRPVTVTVSNGRVIGGTYSDNSAVGSDVMGGLQTMNQLFDSIRTAQTSGQRTDVLYDTQTGHPSFVFMGKDRATTADDTSYIISNVKLNA